MASGWKQGPTNVSHRHLGNNGDRPMTSRRGVVTRRDRAACTQEWPDSGPSQVTVSCPMKMWEATGEAGTQTRNPSPNATAHLHLEGNRV
jgi:hypothetical protein